MAAAADAPMKQEQALVPSPSHRAETPEAQSGAAKTASPRAKKKKKKGSKKAKKEKKSKKKKKVAQETFPDVDDSEFTWVQKLQQNTCDSLNISRWKGKKAKTCPLDLAVLAGALQANRRLKVLFFGKNKFSEEQLLTLADAFATHPRLERLSLDFCEISPTGVKTLLQKLARCKTLRYLDLSSNELGDEGAGHCADYLASPSCVLNVLALNGCGILEEGGKRLAEALATNISLESLSLSRNKLSNPASNELANVLSQEQNLKLTVLSMLQTLVTLEDSIRIKRGLRRNMAMAELRNHKLVFLMATSPTLANKPNESTIRTALLSNGAHHPGYNVSLIKNIWRYMHN